MKYAMRSALGLMALAVAGASPVEASYPLAGTLAKEQSIILSCTVSDTLLAKDCGPLPGRPALSIDKRTQAFINVEIIAPDYLIGATPGAQVLVMVRRSTAAPLDEVNPGRALAPKAETPLPIDEPDWAKRPSQSDIDGYFPERAQRLGVSGSAAVRCTVGPNGDLLGCWLAAENPSTTGFGQATLRLSAFLQMKPLAKDGSSTRWRPYNLRAAFDARTASITLSTGD